MPPAVATTWSSRAGTTRARVCPCCFARGPSYGVTVSGCASPAPTRLRVPDDGIDVLGFLSDEELTEELATAKLLVAPSLGNESFGMVITRAFAAATPVVASDIPGYREIVTPETGVLTPPGDPDALAEAIAAVLADEPARVERGRAARALAESRYAWPLVARRLEDAYERVLDG
jgi:phosphatidylinositol alpha-mannosyltransferase